MNIAFPVLILTLALLPGFLFRYAMLRGSFRRSPITPQQVANDLPWVVIASLAFHGVMLLVYRSLGFNLHLDALLALMIGSYGKDNHFLDQAISDLTGQPSLYFSYLTITYFLGWLFGRGVHDFIRHRRLDLERPGLRLANDWHYWLDREANVIMVPVAVGEIHPDYPRQREVPIYPDVYLTAVVDLKGKDGPYLFRGMVSDWTFSATGDLDTVVLTDVYRRPLQADQSVPEQGHNHQKTQVNLDDRYYRVLGDQFMLRRSEMITMNIQYLYTADDIEAITEDEEETVSATIG